MLAGLAVLLSLALANCATQSATLPGVWRPDDGSSVKTVNEDGSCSGMYYNNGTPLDIGGPMACTLGKEQDNGSYTLVVRQPPNERTYRATFEDNDTLILSDSSGGTIVTLTRQ